MITLERVRLVNWHNFEDSEQFLSSYYMTPNMWKKRVKGFIYTTENLSHIKPDNSHFSTKSEMIKNGTAWYAKLTTMSGSKWKKEYKNEDFIKKYFNKTHTAPYEANIDVLCCDKAIIPIDTDEILAVSVNIIRHGILNAGYKIIDNHCYGPIKDDKIGFVRILIKKEK